MKGLSIATVIALTIVPATARAADVYATVDARSNCTDILNGSNISQSAARITVDPGKYLVTMENNTTRYCGQTTCGVNNIFMYAPGTNLPHHVIQFGHPEYMKVTSQYVYLTFIDNGCSDNSGSARFRFQRIPD